MSTAKGPTSRYARRKKSGNRRKLQFANTHLVAKPLDLESHLPYRIATLSNLMLVDRDPIVRQMTDLGLRELRVLINVGSHMPIRAADIAYQSRMDTFTVSRAVKTLRTEGYVDAVMDPADARVSHLQLSDKGLDLYRPLVQLLNKRAGRITEVLSAEEKVQLLDMLGRLEDRVEEVLADEAQVCAKEGATLSAGQKELMRWFKRSQSDNND